VNKALEGTANGDWTRWYIAFARSPLVIGFNPRSRFARDFQSKPWYEVLEEPGLRLGRTDPKLDPKGALTVALMREAEVLYKMPGLARRILGSAENAAQVLPEETLVGRLQSGELGAGFFYSIETAKAHIPAIALPAALAFGAEYTVTILRTAPNPEGAERFLAFLLGPEGRRLMERHGLSREKPALYGSAPTAIASLVKKEQ
jgi:molybdate/tungstate transport system substrate-binding protein